MSRLALLALATGLLGCSGSAPRPAREPVAAAPPPAPAPIGRSAANDALYTGLQDGLPEGAVLPPISGGTLAISDDGSRAFVSDADRGRVWVVDLLDREVAGSVSLRAGDDPGRIVVAEDGHAFVSLRGGGAVAKIDPEAASLRGRFEVCAEPRGLAIEAERLHVACASGQLLTLSASTGEVTASRFVAADLRDVGVDDEGLWVSRFRSSEWLRPDAGTRHALEAAELPRPGVLAGEPGPYAAAVAWRTFAADGAVTMVHQRHYAGDLTDELVGAQEYYGSGAVKAAVSRWEDGELVSTQAFSGALPVDAAPISEHLVAIAFAASGIVSLIPVGAHSGDMTRPLQAGPDSQPIAVDYHPHAGLLVHTRNAPALLVYESLGGRGWGRVARIPLGDYLFFRQPVGHRMFHRPSRGVACASCHPEGGDDGHVWRLEASPRRTQPLHGGLMHRSAFHWEGDLRTFTELVNNTWVRRMGGQTVSGEEVSELATWLDHIPDPTATPASDPEAAARGRALFEDGTVGCASCHSGRRLTDGLRHDVGTGGSFMTPALVGVARRAPYLHDGCAATIEDRLGRCHTRGHGRLRHLSRAQRADLTAYMRSL